MEAETFFLTLQRMAVRLGLSESWLRAEAEAGRVPHLKVGNRLLFNPATVEQSLLQRLGGSAGKGACVNA